MSVSPSSASAARRVDVVLVGAGLSGSTAALVLGRSGLRVALIDVHEVYPPDFRVEKIAGDQIPLLRRLGLLESVAAASSPFGLVVNVERGKVLDRTKAEHYGVLYDDLVRVMRAGLPASVEFVRGRVATVEAGPERQTITFAGGGVIAARLLVLATGLGHGLRESLGIKRRMLHPGHSVTFGFNVEHATGEFPFGALTYYGERLSDRIDYLNLFPVRGAMRANLFTFVEPKDPWIAAFRRDPKGKLLDVMPGLAQFLGDFTLSSRVETGVMDLYVVEGHRRDGVVLIGDAFQTSCPAAGTGVSRLLCDVDRLCNTYVPRWLATPGMAAAKIAEFYDDPAKRAVDAKAARLADYRRALATEPRLAWRLHRRRMRLRRRVVGWLRQAAQARPLEPVAPR